jgi:signal transduction histidine kinase/CheY-like chemotaxis protein
MASVKIKVSLGYFTLVLLASLMIWVTYSEVLQYTGEKVDFNPANNKFIYINNILTNLYQAEGLERSYVQTGQNKDYHDYLKLMDTISIQIDTLALMVNTPIQQMHTDSIKKLLLVKQQNLKELSAIKKKNSSTARYQRALNKLTANKDSFNHYLKVYKNITTNSDTVYIKQKKKRFFERLANVFTVQHAKDSTLHVVTSRSVRVDSLINPVNPVDTIANYITAVISEIKDDSVAIGARIRQKEQEVLANDRTITLQLRQMLSNIENEELSNSFQKVNAQQSRIEKKTVLIILVGGFALVTIIFFLVNILKDITKSQRYRRSLEEAKAYSESLLRSKEQFMLSLTHDLKSPLSSIIGFTGIMQDVSPKHKKYLQNISKASDHILNLINSLLDLARLETGKLTIDSIPFNLKQLMNDIVEGFRPLAISKNIDLQFKFDISPSLVYVSDPMRITQILGNLISNALKFTEVGKVSIDVTTIGSSDKIDQIRVDVIDSGIGISEENTHHIFDEFTRVSGTTKQYEGTGLGLTITKKLIHLLKGTINLESKVGEGSHFTIFLPLTKGDQMTDSASKESTTNNPEAEKDISGKSVWLVDDDETLLEMTSSILNSAGMVVHSFSNPWKAVSSFEKGCANLLITDIRMPGIGGVEVLKQIQIKNGGPITSIAMSGSNLEENDFADFSVFIQKPFQPQTLIDAISGKLKSIKMEDNNEALGNNCNKGYNLKQIAAFAEGDLESLSQILISFIKTGKQNAKHFRQYLEDENDIAISELSHKMLSLFRQLEVKDIVDLLSQLEHKDFAREHNKQFYLVGKLAIEMIDAILGKIQKDENISID